jgi:TP901 family phage tail tape measure protein
MAERVAYLEAVVGADITSFRRGMRDVRNDLGILSETIKGIGGLGRTLTFAVSAPLLALGSFAVNQAAEFDAAMRNINSIALLTEEQFASLSQRVLDFGKNTREGAIGAAEALYTVYSAGLSGEDAFQLMEVSTKTAEAGLADMTVTTEALATVLLSYGDTSEEAAWRASNALTTMVQLGVGSMENFAGSISTFLPAAKSLGVAFEETFAAQAFLTQRGFSAAEAAVRVNAVMRDMIQPTQAMKAAFQELGVDGAEALITKFGGLTEAVIALAGTTDGSQAAMAELFDETRSRQFVTSVVNDIDAWRESYALFMSSMDGSTMKAWEEQTKSFSYQFDLAKAALSAAAITIGSELLPVLTPAIQGFTEGFIILTELNPQLIELGIGVAAVAIALPPLVWLLSSLVSPIGIVTTGVIALSRVFATNFQGILDVINEVAPGVALNIFRLKTAVEQFFGVLLGTGDQAADAVSEAGLASTAIIDAFKGAGSLFTVSEGDSLWQIWYDHYRGQYATFAEFVERNGFDANEIIVPGQVLRIGASAPIDPATLGAWVLEQQAAIVSAVENAQAEIEVEKFFRLTGADEAAKNMDNFAASLPPNPNTLAGRFQIAVEEVLPRILTHFRSLVSSVGRWIINTGLPMMWGYTRQLVGGLMTWAASEGIPAVLDFIGRLFQGAAGQLDDGVVSSHMNKFTRAFRRFFSGDIIGAIGTFAPELAGSMGTLFANADLTEAVTNFSNRAGEFVSAFGAWLEDEGLDTIAYSIGYLGGRIGALVGQLIGSIWGFFTEGSSGETGAQNLTTNLGEALQSGMQGASDAMFDAGVTNPVDRFFTGLVGMLIAPAVIGGFMQGLITRGFGAAVMGAISGAINAAMWAGGRLMALGRVLMGGIGSAMAMVSGGAVGAAGLIPAAGTFISGLITAIGNVPVRLQLLAISLRGFIGSIAAALGLGTISFSGIATAIMAGVSSAMGLISAGATAVVGAATSLMGAIGAAITALPVFPLVLGTLLIAGAAAIILSDEFRDNIAVPITNAVNDIMGTEFATIDANFFAEQMQKGFLDLTQNPAFRGFGAEFQAEFGIAPTLRVTQEQYDTLLTEWQAAFGDQPFPLDVQVVPTIEETGVFAGVQKVMEAGFSFFAPVTLSAENPLAGNPLDGATFAPDVEATQMATIQTADAVAQAPEVQAAFETAGQTLGEGIMAGLDQAMQTAIANGETFSAETWATDLLLPIETQFNRMFGIPDGVVPVIMGAFVADLSAHVQTIIDEMLRLSGDTLTEFTAYREGILNEINPIIQGFNDLTFAIRETGAAMIALPQGTVNFNAGTTAPAADDDGGGADFGFSGIYRVPRDNYPAVLHDDEMVLSRQEANAYREQQSEPTISGDTLAYGGSGMGGGSTVNNINVYGMQNVDAFLAELKRRGINLQ